MEKKTNQKTPLCPSARPEWNNSMIFGVITGTKDKPSVTYLKESQPVTEELIALAQPVTPTEVFRIGGTCATEQCQHFDGANCTLAQRVVNNLTFPAIFLFERSPNFLLSQSLILSSAIVIKSSLLKTAKSLKPLFGRHFQT